MLHILVTDRPESRAGEPVTETERFLYDIELKDSAGDVRDKATTWLEAFASEHGGRSGEGNRAETILMVE